MSDQSAKPVAAVVPETGSEADVDADVAADASGVSENAKAADIRTENLANLKKVGALHFVAVISALTLFGAAQTWALTSGLALAVGVAIAAAYIAGTVLAGIIHEYGHYSGAVLSGAPHRVYRKPARYFFMFRFDMKEGSERQALWLSWGGLLGSWSLVVALFLLLPMEGWASAAIVATVLGKAVNASIFELPVILKTRATGEFEQALNEQLESPGLVKTPGLVVGLLAFALLT